jgi:uncharacterized SAM-binding protein YcdF (DUF218 family)
MRSRTTGARRSVWRPLAGAIVAGVLCWTAGFAWFLDVTSQTSTPPPPHVDGAVALTGGAGRVELALRLLALGQADKLLVTGIGGNTDLSALGRLAGMDLSPLASRITLGRYAASTRGNAVETAAWAAQNSIRSIIVVTSTYHMPRALVELRQSLPGVQLFPLPVQPIPQNEAEPATVERGPGLRLQAEEYTKFLLAVSGLSTWFPHRDAILPLRPPAVSRSEPAGGTT